MSDVRAETWRPGTPMASATPTFGSHWCQTRNTSWRPRSRERPWTLAGTKHSTLKVCVFSNKTQPQISDWDLKRKFKLDFSLHHKVAAGSWKFRLQLINNYINNNHLYSYILWSRVPHTSIVFCSLPTVPLRLFDKKYFAGFPLNKLQSRVLHLHVYDYDRWDRSIQVKSSSHLELIFFKVLKRRLNWRNLSSFMSGENSLRPSVSG